MVKKITGTFPLTEDERRLWNEGTVAVNLAQHYEEKADHYVEKALKAQNDFWNLVRRTRKLPKKLWMEIHINQGVLKISNGTPESEELHTWKSPARKKKV